MVEFLGWAEIFILAAKSKLGLAPKKLISSLLSLQYDEACARHGPWSSAEI
jgi:hypothetical protein